MLFDFVSGLVFCCVITRHHIPPTAAPQSQEAATVVAKEAELRTDQPGSHLMHKDVCTAEALPGLRASPSQQEVATAPQEAAALVSISEEPTQNASPHRSKSKEGSFIDRKHPLGAIQKRAIETTEGKSLSLTRI